MNRFHTTTRTNSIRRRLFASTTILLANSALFGQTLTIDFEDLPLTVPPTQNYAPGGVFYNGSDNAGQFTSGGAVFENTFTDFGSFTIWSGWSYSTTTDASTRGFSNQYSAIAGAGADGSAAYGIFYQAGTIILPSGWDRPLSMEVTNTTYAFWDMVEGSPFSKAFGGPGGTDPDFFRLTIQGLDATGNVTGAPVEFFLADYRSTANSLIEDWTTVDLRALGTGVRELRFFLDSSDSGAFGMNTPAYFALDNLVLVPEPDLAPLLAGWVGICLAGAGRRIRT